MNTARAVTSGPSLRTRMGWLHAWVGFVCGLLLLCIFITGTLAVFDTEITRWMQPEFTGGSLARPSDAALARASALVSEQEAQHHRVSVTLPSARDPVLRVVQPEGMDVITTAIDPVTGEVLNLRKTVGGTLFFRFHYTLRMGRMFGVVLVEALGIGLLVTLGSGLVIHLRALVPNLVMFRPNGASPRAWMDAHVIAAVLFLPFTFMVAWTGVVIHADRIFPFTAEAHQEGGGGPPGRGQHEYHRDALPIPALGPILDDATQLFGEGGSGFLQFSPYSVSVMRSDASTLAQTRDRAEYDRRTGERLKVTRQRSGPAQTRQVMTGLHMAHWAPTPMRWLYFLSGIAGSVMFGTGLVMFLLKRRRTATSRHFLALVLAEGLTLGTVIGLPAACAAVLWANRLVPATLTDRMATESTCLFLMWGACIAHALARALQKHVLHGWREQAALLAALLCLLPALDIATRWQWLGQQKQWDYLGVDAAALMLGLMVLRGCVFLDRSIKREIVK
ncbi:PepSY domain-containing protein [Acetobacter estunensis]|uniref:PepSY-associated TM helix domain-containing protein n=1 Tax=Acetobacter estunensis TaxID=104097 RepID=UPI001C2CDA51|nr:PepSY-associated TM helix domain-containing protein [Acetobacter estunensis]MBV1838766.1 PepSY domain-containing protein [Acetobacter estunensis]